MSNIRKAFENGKAFIPFITCGDPDLETTKAAVREMVKNGADFIELGIPFSDPTAEGPVIQEANVRALSGGVTTDKIFEMVRELRGSGKADGGPVTGDGAIAGCHHDRRDGPRECQRIAVGEQRHLAGAGRAFFEVHFDHVVVLGDDGARRQRVGR